MIAILVAAITLKTTDTGRSDKSPISADYLKTERKIVGIVAVTVTFMVRHPRIAVLGRCEERLVRRDSWIMESPSRNVGEEVLGTLRVEC